MFKQHVRVASAALFLLIQSQAYAGIINPGLAYRIVSGANGNVLDASTDADKTIDLAAPNDPERFSQRWTLEPQTNGAYAFRNIKVDARLTGVSGVEIGIGEVRSAAKEDVTEQKWFLQETKDGQFLIVNGFSQLCLSGEIGAASQQSCNGSSAQTWRLEPVNSTGKAVEETSGNEPEPALSGPESPAIDAEARSDLDDSQMRSASSDTLSATGDVCGNNICDRHESYLTCAKDCKNRVGVFYSGWQLPAWNAARIAKERGQPVLTVEKVLQSRKEGGPNPLTLQDIWINKGLDGVAGQFYYQGEPEDGFYCIVKKRKPGQLNYIASHEGDYGMGVKAPDCPMAESILTKQAKQMLEAGIDYVVMDGTNITENSPFGDAIQLRPFEVMVEVWSKLRAKGIMTPEVAIWQRLPVYPANSTDKGKDWLYKRALAVYNTKAYDNVIMKDKKTGKKVFFYPDLNDFNPSFVSSVRDNAGIKGIVAVPMWAWGKTPKQWSFLSTCASNLIDNSECNQPMTTDTVLGSQMAVSPHYQLTYASRPYSSTGVMNGLTLRKMFETVFKKRPDYLLLTGWNEQVAQPQRVAGNSMGLETDPTARDLAFVDLFGVEHSRDLEPSKEYGSRLYSLVKSCLRVYRSATKICNRSDEICCKTENFDDRYTKVNGGGGEFTLLDNKVSKDANMAQLYSCRSGSDTFYTLQSNCEGLGGAQKLGYISTFKGRETIRTLRRCYGNGRHTYSLETYCPNGMRVESVLGYVR